VAVSVTFPTGLGRFGVLFRRWRGNSVSDFTASRPFCAILHGAESQPILWPGLFLCRISRLPRLQVAVTVPECTDVNR
jgi:hypothetical protein